MKVTIASFTLPVPDGAFPEGYAPYYSCEIGMITSEATGGYIKMFGEVFKVIENNPRFPDNDTVRNIKMICERFPTNKSHLVERLTGAVDIDYEVVSKAHFTKKWIKSAGTIKN